VTERKTMTRRRRTSGAVAIPKTVASWFAGEPRAPGAAPIPWDACAFPGYMLIGAWWRAWSEANPGHEPPAGHEWVADPDDARHRGTHFAGMDSARAAAKRHGWLCE
jgi:hypothetical protein